MYTNRKYIVRLFFAIVMVSGSLASCKKYFEETNTNPYKPTDKMLTYNNLKVGAYFMQLAKAVIPIGSPAQGTGPVNDYQIAVDLCSNNWAGYTAANSEKFNSGNNLTTYFFNGWEGGAFDRHTVDIINPWMEIKRNTEKDAPQLFSIGQIMKVAGYHQSTDMFGPMPYKNTGLGSLTVPYDSQRDIYNAFFSELGSAVTALTPFANGEPLIPQYDVVYGGNVKKWIQFANSLMLRLAIRISYAEPDTAKKYAELAVANPFGMITKIEDAAQMKTSSISALENPMETLWNGYGDTRLGASITSYLKGYNDPRLEKYAQKVKINGVEGYFGVRTAIPMLPGDYSQYSAPNITRETPLYWLMASEISFLRAEGALRGWKMGGSAEQFYKEGIQKSFQEHGISNTTYSENSSSKPSAYIDPFNNVRNAVAPGTVTIKWNETDGFEIKLEKIITQKWIALFPNGPEAWAEHRRTGYPKLFPISLNRSGGIVNSDLGIRRMKYPQSEYNLNGANLQQGITLLGGPDNGATKVWWDEK